MFTAGSRCVQQKAWGENSMARGGCVVDGRMGDGGLQRWGCEVGELRQEGGERGGTPHRPGIPDRGARRLAARLPDHAAEVGADAVVVKDTLDLAVGGEREVGIPQVGAGHTLDVLDADRVNGRLDLLRRVALAGGDELSSNVLGNGGGAVEAEQQARLELRLGTLHLTLGGCGAHALPLTKREVDEIVELQEVLRDHVDTPETRVRVRGGEVHERVGEVVGRDNVRQARREQRARAERAVPVAHDALQHEHGEVVGRLPRDTLDGERKVAGGRGVVADAHLGADEAGLGRRGLAELDGALAHGEAAKVLLGELDERVVLDATGTDENHAVGGVVGLDVLGEVLTLDREDVLLGAEDGAAQRLALEGDRVKVVEHDLLLELVNLLLLAEDDVALALDRGVLELRVLQDVRDDVDGLVDVLAEGLGVVDGLLSRGVGVEVSAEVLDLELKSVLGSLASACWTKEEATRGCEKQARIGQQRGETDDTASSINEADARGSALACDASRRLQRMLSSRHAKSICLCCCNVAPHRAKAVDRVAVCGVHDCPAFACVGAILCGSPPGCMCGDGEAVGERGGLGDGLAGDGGGQVAEVEGGGGGRDLDARVEREGWKVGRDVRLWEASSARPGEPSQRSRAQPNPASRPAPSPPLSLSRDGDGPLARQATAASDLNSKIPFLPSRPPNGRESERALAAAAKSDHFRPSDCPGGGLEEREACSWADLQLCSYRATTSLDLSFRKHRQALSTMAEAGPSSAAMASAPLHHVAAAHQSELYAFLSANSVQLVDITSEAKPTTLAIPTTVFVPQPTLPDQSDAERYADQPHISFARLASFSHSDRFLALTGDDKVLRVWKLQRDADNRFEFGKEIVIKLLPKRAAVLHWMPPTDNTPAGSEELIVIDRFGDVRSIMVNENDVRTLPSTSPDADAKVDASADEQDQMDSPTDASMQILLGHVSMITSLAFIPAAKQGAPPAYIITGDRDEHIRISRWGHSAPRQLGRRPIAACLDVAAALGTSDRLGGRHELRTRLPLHQRLGLGSRAFRARRDREERKRESKALQASSKRNKAAKRKQDQRGTDGSASEAAEAKPLAAQYAKDSRPTVVISDLLPFINAEGTQWLLVVVEGATAFFHIPVSALLEPVPSEDKKRDISSQIRVTRAAAPILNLALVQRAASAGVSVIATFDTRPEFRGEAEAADDASAEAAVFRLDAAGNFARESESPLIQALLPATEPSAGASDEAPRALLDASIVEHLGLYPALTTWPKIEVPSSAEIIATRSSRKGRFNHPLDTSLIGVAEVNETKPSTASSDPAADDAQRRKLVKTMQGARAGLPVEAAGRQIPKAYPLAHIVAIIIVIVVNLRQSSIKSRDGRMQAAEQRQLTESVKEPTLDGQVAGCDRIGERDEERTEAAARVGITDGKVKPCRGVLAARMEEAGRPGLRRRCKCRRGMALAHAQNGVWSPKWGIATATGRGQSPCWAPGCSFLDFAVSDSLTAACHIIRSVRLADSNLDQPAPPVPQAWRKCSSVSPARCNDCPCGRSEGKPSHSQRREGSRKIRSDGRTLRSASDSILEAAHPVYFAYDPSAGARLK
ncbi:hypothetical protein L1887_57284 [Cichorium endivia]|nr:hypothetical protein L1887_57284 [Cichorium endivia]